MSLLHGKGLSLTLDGQGILEGIDIELQAGEMLGLIGPNGAGKSSLLKIIAGLYRADTGILSLGDRVMSSIPIYQRARRIAWLPQRGEVHWPMTVETVIELGRLPHLNSWEQPGKLDRNVIERVIEQTDLLSMRDRPFNTLSGGEQARVLLARALATEPEILLADEPVAALDLAHQLDMMALLANYCGKERGVIVVLHDLPLAAQFCQRLQLLHNGETLAEGKAETVLSQAHLKTAYQIQLNPGASAVDPFSIPWQRIPQTNPTD